MTAHEVAAVDGAGAPGGAYERLSYPGYAYASTHPWRLEAIGRLFGLDPAPAATCRVLELGCGDGGNALSIAQTLPHARVVGIDAAASAIARGAGLARAAGLANVELRQGDFERLPDDLGSFDYVIAHGVYSWIPPSARVALLDCVRRRMAPAGIAFVSYNAYPGSYLRDMARDVLRYHLRDVTDPEAQLAAAHELMEAIVAIEEPSPYARVLREHLERMLSASDALLFHDDLAEISTPFYFHEFIEHAAGHGLRFLAEADLFESQMRGVPDSAEHLMQSLPADVVVREQYLDFFKNRMFRQTLLCHADAPIARALDDRALERMAIASPARSEDPAAAEETFVTAEGWSMTTSEPLVRAAMHALGDAWPAALGFPTLLSHACEAVGPSVSRELVAARLRDVLLQAHLARLMTLHGCSPPVAASPGDAGERPLASPLARAQHAAGGPAVSSLLHTNVRLEDALEVALVPLLDGTRGWRELERAVGKPAAVVEAALERLASVGLLMRMPDRT